jgi:hypothetical protein
VIRGGMSHARAHLPCSSIAHEFRGADLGDKRLEDRLVRVAEQCHAAPDQSFPDIAPGTPELTAMYRFLRSEAVTLASVLEPHFVATSVRCAEAGRVLVLHDTTECEFPGEKRRGLGPLHGKDQGFLLHPALAVAADGSRRPLGLLAAHTWKRQGLGRTRRADGARKTGSDYHRETHKESARWWKGVDAAEQRLGGVEAIHVTDREGDAYHILRDALDHGVRFVIRMARDRRLLDEDEERLGKTSEVLAHCEDVFTVEVPLSRRPHNPTPRSFPAREARLATLAVTGLKSRVARPSYDRHSPESLEVNIVCVREAEAPPGIEPVAWVLMTTEPIDKPADLRAVIEFYRARWMIEEFFKALKTGCAFEKRQLESYDTLTVALGIFLPIAWQLLLLRYQAQHAADEPARCVLSPVQLDVLRARVPHLVPLRATAADALRAVAYLGGHFIKRPPGWLVLGRGLQTLLDLEAGWRLARGMEPQL